MVISNLKLSLNFNKDILIFLILVALFFDPTIQDPFNVSKQILLILFTSWILGYFYLIRNSFLISLKENRLFVIGVFLFLFGISGSLIFTKPLYVGLLGDNLRRNGFLTYLCLLVILVLIYSFFKFEIFTALNRAFIIVGVVVGCYGLLQSQGVDFFAWNNPYNSIIGTVGNPNFAAALMAIISSFLTIRLFDSNLNSLKKIMLLLLLAILIYNINESNSRQGILAFVFAIGLSLYFFIKVKNNLYSKIYLTIFSLAVILGIAGMLQKGPLLGLLYKDSVSVRGYYWRAAVRMFIDHPWFGVGVDSYGSYFKEYREVGYPLKYGFEITSSNAHSVPLQFLSTCGLFAFIGFLLIQICVLKSGLFGANKLTGSDKNLLLATFSAWLAYQAQSIISIDQIALASWGWILGAVLIGHAKSNIESVQVRNKTGSITINSKKSAQKVFSYLFLVITLLPISWIYRGEKSMWETRSLASSLAVNNNDSQLRQLVVNSAEKTKSSLIQDPYYIFLASTYESDYGLNNLGLESIKKLLTLNPRNTDYLNALAFYFERNGNLAGALEYRKALAKYDPFNARNYLQMGRSYKFLGDFSNMDLMLGKILMFARDTDIGRMAISELKRN